MASLIITIQFTAVLTALILISVCLVAFLKREGSDAVGLHATRVVTVNRRPRVQRIRLARWFGRRTSGM